MDKALESLKEELDTFGDSNIRITVNRKGQVLLFNAYERAMGKEKTLFWWRLMIILWGGMNLSEVKNRLHEDNF